MVLFSAMVAYVWQRRASRLNATRSTLLVLAGLIVPPAVVPTIWVLQKVGLFKTMPGLILVEIAFGLPFCVLLFRAFMASVPRELDEAAVVDGAGPMQIFFRVIFPVLRSVMMTVIILQTVFVYNDFQNPLYFLPGTQNATVQVTLLNFQSQFTHPIQPAVRQHLAGDNPAADHVHLLQPQDRRGHGRRLGQGLTPKLRPIRPRRRVPLAPARRCRPSAPAPQAGVAE